MIYSNNQHKKNKCIKNIQAEILSTKYHIHKNKFSLTNEKNVLI